MLQNIAPYDPLPDASISTAPNTSRDDMSDNNSSFSTVIARVKTMQLHNVDVEIAIDNYDRSPLTVKELKSRVNFC
jgi:hypothetical protein